MRLRLAIAAAAASQSIQVCSLTCSRQAPNALLTVNHAPAQTVRLRNGDTIELGSARLQFWLAQGPQRGLRLREWIVWLLIAAICLGQVALVYWLPR